MKYQACGLHESADRESKGGRELGDPHKVKKYGRSRAVMAVVISYY
jgi:hypothetical protein